MLTDIYRLQIHGKGVLRAWHMIGMLFVVFMCVEKFWRVKMPDKDGFVNLRLLPKIKGKDLFCSTRIHYINGKSLQCIRTLGSGGKWVVVS